MFWEKGASLMMSQCSPDCWLVPHILCYSWIIMCFYHDIKSDLRNNCSLKVVEKLDHGIQVVWVWGKFAQSIQKTFRPPGFSSPNQLLSCLQQDIFISIPFLESCTIGKLIATPILLLKGYRGQHWNMVFHQLWLNLILLVLAVTGNYSHLTSQYHAWLSANVMLSVDELPYPHKQTRGN